MTDITKIDHQGRVVDTLAVEYSESTNLIKYIQALVAEGDELEQTFCDIILLRRLENAQGAALDIIGDLVGQPRILIDSTTVSYFGFQGAIGALTFSTLNDPSVGGRFRSLNEAVTGNRTLIDEEYRLFIRARIVNNSINPTIPEMISFMRFLFEVDFVDVQDGITTGEYDITIGRPLSLNEQTFLVNTNLVPKVKGYRPNYKMIDIDGNVVDIN